MPNYKCPKCSYTTKRKCHIIQHQNKKGLCKDEVVIFNKNEAIDKAIEEKDKTTELLEMIDKLTSENEKLLEMIDKLTSENEELKTEINKLKKGINNNSKSFVKQTHPIFI